MKVVLELDGERFEVALEDHADGLRATVDGHEMDLEVLANGHGFQVTVDDEVHHVESWDPKAVRIDGTDAPYRILSLQGVAGALAAEDAGHASVKPPMNGKLESLLVAEGDAVQAGQVLFVLEAMKMRNEVKSPMDGVVASVHAHTGDTVLPQDVVVEIKAEHDRSA